MADTVAVTYFEGEEWVAFEGWRANHRHVDRRVHSVLFDDGEVWDAVNGWRQQSPQQREFNRQTVRRFRPEPVDGAGWAEAAFEPKKFVWESPYVSPLQQLMRGYP